MVDSDDVLGLNKMPDDDLLGWGGDNDRRGLPPPDDIDWDDEEDQYYDDDAEGVEEYLYDDEDDGDLPLDEEHFEEYQDNYDDYDEGISYNSDLGIGGASATAQPPTATTNADNHLDRMLQAVRERRGTVFAGAAAAGGTRPPQRSQAVEQLLQGHQDDPYQASRRL
eukprot:TRINITY_DN4971_c0_g1_i1.p1 TRINITY_DN4971_c0_g1~~TRINITY_DN4971_c0_g1_i1.p1  ORF type:complete len:167 (-),score=32.69 TRINITY_DN4971_c0_g1_i1:14-514(-)